MDELKCRKRVLRRLGYASAADAIEMKGRTACEISSADELLLTELLYNGVFNGLEVPQICALVSCFVFEERSFNAETSKLSDELSGPLRIMQDTARRIAKVWFIRPIITLSPLPSACLPSLSVCVIRLVSKLSLMWMRISMYRVLFLL